MPGFAQIRMGERKKIALIAHDNEKDDLIAWMRYNRDLLPGTNCAPRGRRAG